MSYFDTNSFPETTSKTAKAGDAPPVANTSAKRKASDDTTAPAAKKARTTKTAPAVKKTAPATKKTAPAAKKIAPAAKKAAPAVKKTVPTVKKNTPAINEIPTEILDVYVCGQGDSGELGLGTDKKGKGVRRPRINHLLDAEKVGVVQIATGGMHAAALTRDNLILTWGVNDQGALGRDTEWDGGLKDMDAADDSDSEAGDDNGLNPKEAIPTAIPTDAFPEGLKFVQLVASDSATFALTADGLVYGWGTFRVI